MTEPKANFDREMAVLDAEMKRLEAEYNMFFAGRLPRLPWETRARVDALVKKHDRSHIQNTADRFRFQTMQNRYAKFCELWERQLSQLEGGRPRRLKKTAGGAPEPAETSRTKSAEAAKKEKSAPRTAERPAERVVRFSSEKPATGDDDRVKELYKELTEARKSAGQAPLAYENVAALVKAQMQKHSQERGNVAFRVITKDGKVSLSVDAEKKTDK